MEKSLSLSLRRPSIAVSLVSLLVVGACVTDGSGELKDKGPIDLSAFYVSDFFTPSGHMGDGQEPGHITMNANDHCLPRPEGAGGNCYRFIYGPPGNAFWGGVFWQFPANNWGGQEGRYVRGWVYDPDLGNQLYPGTPEAARTIRQRYNRLRFFGASRRDVLDVHFRALTDEGGTPVCYTLTNVQVTVTGADGSVQQALSSGALEKAAPDPSTSVSGLCEAKSQLVVPPGAYTVTFTADGVGPVTLLRSTSEGTAPVATTAATTPDAADASLHAAVSMNVEERATLVTHFDYNGAAGAVPFLVETPRMELIFLAGGIADPALVSLQCSQLGRSCLHEDNLVNPKVFKTESVPREWVPYNAPIQFQPPCVANAADERPVADMVNGTSSFVCPEGTIQPDPATGRMAVATCPRGLTGGMNPDGSIACCDGGVPSRVAETGLLSCGNDSMRDENGNFIETPKPIFTGSWEFLDEVIGTVVGAFGWVTSYVDFETAPQSMELILPADQVPKTYIYVDDIVWDYAVMPPAP
jgi:hypothetical protein